LKKAKFKAPFITREETDKKVADCPGVGCSVYSGVRWSIRPFFSPGCQESLFSGHLGTSASRKNIRATRHTRIINTKGALDIRSSMPPCNRRPIIVMEKKTIPNTAMDFFMVDYSNG